MRSYIEGYESSGKGCYVDSTPLPNEIRRLISNAYCSHGKTGSCSQTRLFLVLDEETDLPVWYGLTPGNVLDLSTISDITSDTFISVGVEIDSMVLDASYITREFLAPYTSDSGKMFSGKSPASCGFQYKTRYHEVKNLIPNAKYEILQNGKAYFAYKKECGLFGKKVDSYIFVDQMKALSWHTEYIEKHWEEFERMSDKEKNWNRVKNGFFILLSNIDTHCEEILNRYIERVDIESVFKDAKDYGNLLPLSKWDKTRVDGKIFSDMLTTIVILLLKKKLVPKGYSIPDFAGKPGSLMCCRNSEDIVNIEMPNMQVKELSRILNIPVPGTLDLNKYSRKIYDPTFG
ncbi:transposase [Ileibacterium valens]|nr:transposase [Ileibacterium valens]